MISSIYTTDQTITLKTNVILCIFHCKDKGEIIMNLQKKIKPDLWYDKNEDMKRTPYHKI